MNTIPELEARREAVLQEMLTIHSLHRGTINKQYLEVRHKGKPEPVLRGPYYVFSRREGNRTVSRRLTSAAELERARQDVAAHQRFVALCQEFESLTEKLGRLESEESGALERGKKRRRSRSSKTAK